MTGRGRKTINSQLPGRKLASDGSSAGADQSALPPICSRHLERHREGLRGITGLEYNQAPMAKKIIGLGGDGKLVLSLPGGKTEPLPVPAPPRVFLLIDCSSSMSGSKITQAAEGALAFARDALKKQYSIGLIAFASEAEILCRTEDNLSIIASKAQRLTASGSTNMTDGLERAAAELENTAGVRAIVIVTDGMPDNQQTALQAARRAKESGIDIIAIGTDDADRTFLEQIASRSELAMKVSRTELQSGVAGAAKLLPGSTRPR